MRWIWPTVTAGVVIEGLLLRQRIAALDVLTPTDRPAAPDHRLVTATGVVVDDATRRAASSYARDQGLEALDLVPGDLPVERLLDLARQVDPVAFRERPLATGRGALQAVLVTRDVAARAGLETLDGLDPPAMVAAMRTLKDHAPRATGHALAPTLRAGPDDAGGRLAALQASTGPPVVVGGVVADLALLGGAARRRRPWAVAAVAARVLEPQLVVAGSRARPRDLPGALARRLAAPVRDLPRALAGRRDRARAEAVEQRRAEYARLLADGTAGFFAPRRPDCPLCGAGDLRVRLRSGDLIQCKPGTFTLEECTACGHIFQNPCLNAAGLDFYYADFYDGAHEDAMGGALATLEPFYAARAEMVRGVATPRRWLDVGGGHGHFCLTARATWPETTFDAVDMSGSIEAAERRGWTDTSYRGMFPDLVRGLAGRYDVVSMFHYLEHIPDPAAELDAAVTALSPDGLLMIEVPDPASRLAPLLGAFWPPWGQPQHLHFFTVENLTAMLAARGFTPVSVVRAAAHIPFDCAGAATELVNRIQPPVDQPWMPPSTPSTRARRGAALVAGAPAMAVGVLADLALRPLNGGLGTSNTYRILARRAG